LASSISLFGYTRPLKARAWHIICFIKRISRRIRFQRVGESTGKEVPAEEIVKGHEVEENHYVILADADEMQKLIEAKAKGQKREAPAPQVAKGNVIDLVAALQESLGSVKKAKTLCRITHSLSVKGGSSILLALVNKNRCPVRTSSPSSSRTIP
jgi:hypothetical protein